MPLRTACSSCGKKLQVRDELAGKKVKCPDCGKVFIAAAGASAAGDAAAIKASPSKGGPPPMAKDKVSAKPMARKPAPPPIDDEEDEDIEERPMRRGRPAASGGGRRLLWIVLAGVLVLGGAAAGYYFFLMDPPAGVGPIVRKSGPPKDPVDTNVETKDEKTEPKENIGVPTKIEVGANAGLAELVPGDALFFASVSGELWNAKGLDSLRPLFGKMVEEGLQSTVGISVADIDRVSMFSVTTLEDAKKHSVGPTVVPVVVMMQTKQPMNKPAVTAALRKGELGRNKNSAIEFVNDRTVVTSLAPLLQIYKNKLGKMKASGVLERALAQASTSKGIVVAVSIPPEVVPLAEQGLQDAPFDLGPFLKTKAVLATVDLTDKLKLNATLIMDDAADADGAKKAADGLVAMASFMVGGIAKDPQLAEVGKVAQKALGDLKINAKDKELSIAFEGDFGVLMAVALPAIEKIRGAATAAGDTNNLKQIALAWLNYHDVYKSYPPQSVGKGLSWRVAILPYVEQDNLYKQFKLDEPWDSEHNKKLIPLMPKIYGGGGNAKPGFTFIQTFVGRKTINADQRKGMAIQRITDGSSNTLIVAEAAKAVEWTKPDDIAVTDGEPIVLGGANPKFTMAALADGSVRRLPRDLDQKILRLLIDPADNMVIPDFNGPGPKKSAPVFKSPPKQRDGKEPEAPKTKVPEATGKDKKEAKLTAPGKQLPQPKVVKIARGKRADIGGGDKFFSNLKNENVVVLKLEGIPATVKGFEILRGATYKAGNTDGKFNTVLGDPPRSVWVGGAVPVDAKTMTITLPGNIAPFTVDLPAKVEDEVKAFD